MRGEYYFDNPWYAIVGFAVLLALMLMGEGVRWLKRRFHS